MRVVRAMAFGIRPMAQAGCHRERCRRAGGRQWLRSAGLAFLALSTAFSGGLLWAHGVLTRRLMGGAAVRIGTERVRTRRWEVGLPGPPAFWALFRKDWTYLRRSPTTLRALVSTPIVAVAFGVGLWQVANVLPEESVIRQAVPFLAATVVLVSANLGTSNLIGNYFGNPAIIRHFRRKKSLGLVVIPKILFMRSKIQIYLPNNFGLS